MDEKQEKFCEAAGTTMVKGAIDFIRSNRVDPALLNHEAVIAAINARTESAIAEARVKWEELHRSPLTKSAAGAAVAGVFYYAGKEAARSVIEGTP